MRWVKYGGHRRLGVDDQWRVAKWKAHPYVWRLRRRKTRQILRFKKRSRHRNQTDENLDQLWWTRGRKLKECVGKKSWGPACWRLAATGFAFNGQSTNASVLSPRGLSTAFQKNIQSSVNNTSRQPKNNSSLSDSSMSQLQWLWNRAKTLCKPTFVTNLYNRKEGTKCYIAL